MAEKPKILWVDYTLGEKDPGYLSAARVAGYLQTEGKYNITTVGGYPKAILRTLKEAVDGMKPDLVIAEMFMEPVPMACTPEEKIIAREGSRGGLLVASRIRQLEATLGRSNPTPVILTCADNNMWTDLIPRPGGTELYQTLSNLGVVCVDYPPHSVSAFEKTIKAVLAGPEEVLSEFFSPYRRVDEMSPDTDWIGPCKLDDRKKVELFTYALGRYRGMIEGNYNCGDKTVPDRWLSRIARFLGMKWVTPSVIRYGSNGNISYMYHNGGECLS